MHWNGVADTVKRAKRELRIFLHFLYIDNVHQLIDMDVDAADLNRRMVGQAGFSEQLEVGFHIHGWVVRMRSFSP